MYELPVWNTIGTVYRFIWTERMSWLKFAAVLVALSIVGPFLLLIPTLGLAGVLELISGGEPTAAQETTMGIGLGIVVLVFVVAYIALMITFMVAWHRHYLLDPRASSIRELFVWKRRHWLFFGRCVLLGILAIILFFAAAAVIGPILSPILGIFTGASSQPSFGSQMPTFSAGMFVAPLIFMAVLATVVLFFTCFLLLSLPSAAIEDREITLRNAVRLSKGNRFNMTWVIWFGSFLPFWGIPAVLQIVLLSAAISGHDDAFQQMGAMAEAQSTFTMTVVYPIFSTFFSMLGLAIGVSLLSASFRRLRDNVPLETPPEAPAA